MWTKPAVISATLVLCLVAAVHAAAVVAGLPDDANSATSDRAAATTRRETEVPYTMLTVAGALPVLTAGGASVRAAYVTVVYEESFILAVRVLVKSVLDTKTPYPFVVLVTADVGSAFRRTLIEDGCIVQEVERIANPHVDHPSFQRRLLYVFTKLHLFRLDFDRIVYLDADIVVTRNIEEMFQCGDVCASPRGSFFNAGVLVLTPRLDIFLDLYGKRKELTSYNGGEQGFLNNYFNKYGDSKLFQQDAPVDTSTIESVHDCRGKYATGKIVICQKLSSFYNGDIGYYYLRNGVWWMESAGTTQQKKNALTMPKIIHFTLGPVKPWLWWSYPIFELNTIWYHIFYDLERNSYFGWPLFTHLFVILKLWGTLYWLSHNLREFSCVSRLSMTKVGGLLRRLGGITNNFIAIGIIILSLSILATGALFAFLMTNWLFLEVFHYPLVTWMALFTIVMVYDFLLSFFLLGIVNGLLRRADANEVNTLRTSLLSETRQQYVGLYIVVLCMTYVPAFHNLILKGAFLALSILIIMLWRIVTTIRHLQPTFM